MKTIDKANARKELVALQERVDALKSIIDSPINPMECIKTYNDACEHLGVDPNELPFKSPSNADQEAINANWKMWRIAKALNGDWEPNWNDSNEYKYFPYFNMKSAGVGFSITYYGHWTALTTVGSRLCFKSRELAEYAGTQFADIYKKIMVLPNTK